MIETRYRLCEITRALFFHHSVNAGDYFGAEEDIVCSIE